MKNIPFLVLVALAVIGGSVAVVMNNPTPPEQAIVQTNPEETLTYFINVVTEEVKKDAEYEKKGLGGGVDAFSLLRAYPRLEMSAFRNVVAYQGEYSMQSNELFFTGNGASNSAVIEREGMKTLLDAISESLGIQAASKADIDTLITKLKAKTYDLVIEDQIPGPNVIVTAYAVSKPGFIVVYENTPTQNPGKVLGISELLDTKDGKNLAIRLNRFMGAGERLYAIMYIDNGDGVFDLRTDTQAMDAEGVTLIIWFSAGVTSS